MYWVLELGNCIVTVTNILMNDAEQLHLSCATQSTDLSLALDMTNLSILHNVELIDVQLHF